MASASSSKRSWSHERVVGEPALEHRQARPVVVELLGGLGSPPPTSRAPASSAARAPWRPCRRRRRRARRGSASRDRVAQPRLALGVGAVAATGSRDRAHQRRRPRAPKRCSSSRGVASVSSMAVVEHAGGDDLVRVAAGAQQLRDLERVQDERRRRSASRRWPVVALGGELQGAAGQWQPVHECRKFRHQPQTIRAVVSAASKITRWGSQHERLALGHDDRVLGVRGGEPSARAHGPAVRHPDHLAAPGGDDRLDREHEARVQRSLARGRGRSGRSAARGCDGRCRGR